MGETEPLERDAELQQVAELLAMAGNGRGQARVIEGPAGVGKSRLLDECAASAEASGMTVLRGRCSELTQDYPFGVVRNLFENTVIGADSATRATLLHGPAALCAPIFGHGETTDVFAVLHGLYWLTVNLAEQRPLVILLDDMPLADDFSLRFLSYLVDRIDDVACAVICTLRTGDSSAESALVTQLWEAASAPSIRPKELTDDAVKTLLVAALPGRSVDAQLVMDVVRQTGGNPFLVVAVAQALRAGEDPDVTTPELVRRSIARRLGRLGATAHDVAKAGSVLGDDAQLHHVVRLASLPPEQGRAAADELVAAHLFKTAHPVTFVHGIVRAAVYGLLPSAERLALHASAAQLLAADGAAPEVVAEHLLLSGASGADWGVTALHHAGQASLRKGAPSAALRYLRHAVDTADVAQLPSRLLIDLGLAEAAAGEPMSLHRFERALMVITEPAERAETLYSLGQTLYQFGRFAEASVAFRRGADLFEDDDEQIRLRFIGAAWGAETPLSPVARAQPATFTRDGPGTRAVLAVGALHQSLTTPPVDVPAEMALRALGDGALLAEQGSQGASINLAILALLHCERLAEANAAADAAVSDAHEHGAQLSYAQAAVVRSLVLNVRGRVTDAAADAQAALECLEPRAHSHAKTALGVLIHCMIERGEVDGAAELVGRLDAFPATPTPTIDAYAGLARGRLYMRRNDIGAARDALELVEVDCRGFSTDNPAALPWRSMAGLVAHLAGEHTRGRALIEEEVRLARLFHVDAALGVALQRRALTEDADTALATLAEAIDVLTHADAAVQLARAHGGLGRGLRRSGQRVRARHHLKVGMDLAHRSGATGLEAEIRDELGVAGGRPRRTSVTGVDALSPTELRIARHAESGLTNSEIAEQSFVSRSTVAWHLRNIYRKLQIDSREALRLPAEQ